MVLEPGEALSTRDVDRIAAIHVASIEDSLVTLIGGDYARRFYYWLADSEHEWILIERIDGGVESACVVSLEPASLYSRCVRATWPSLVRSSLSALFRRLAFWSFLLSFARDGLRSGATAAPGPEITFIFTSERSRGSGLGGRLLRRADAFFRRRGMKTYFVKTIDDPANRALSFYDRNGFRRIARKTEGGRRFMVFQKRPAAPKTAG